MSDLTATMQTPNEEDVPFSWDNVALVLSYAKPHWKTLVVGLVLGLGVTAVSLASPLATKWILDSLGNGLDLWQPIGLLVGLMVLGAAVGFIQGIVMGRLSEQIVVGVRISLIERFFRSTVEKVQRISGGEMVTRVVSDTQMLRSATTDSIISAINGLIALIGTIILMAILDLPLLLSTLVGLIVIGVLLGVIIPKMGKAQKQSQEAIAEMGKYLHGGMGAIRTVKASRAEDREITRVVAKVQESAQHAIRALWIGATAGPIASGGVQLTTIAILGLGAYRVSTGDLSVSTLVAFLLYAFYIVEPIAELVGAFVSLQSGLAAASRIRDTEALTQEDLHAHASVDPVHSTDPSVPVVALDGVHATYLDRDQEALSGVSLTIPQRGHIAIVGPSGAGKTTIFSLLLRLIDPTDGRIYAYGKPYDQLSIDQVRRLFAYVEQDTPVIPGSVRENVAFRVPDAEEDELWAALAAVRLDEKIRELPDGLDTQVMGAVLSGGERQRLAVARALVQIPAVLLLDESTAQLDALTEAAIQTVIADTAKTGAVITIAHRLSTVLEADQIIVLDQGQIRARGTHAELLTQDALYRDLVEALHIDVSRQ